jgi:hypothetical protein
MSENPALELLRTFFAGAGFQEVPATKTYTRDDLVRVVLAQQWAVAIACHHSTWGHIDECGMSVRLSNLPCAHDVVEGMEQP